MTEFWYAFFGAWGGCLSVLLAVGIAVYRLAKAKMQAMMQPGPGIAEALAAMGAPDAPGS